MHGSTRIFWADLTPVRSRWQAELDEALRGGGLQTEGKVGGAHCSMCLHVESL